MIPVMAGGQDLLRRDLPERLVPDRLRELDPGELAAAEAELRSDERETVAAMAPFEQRLREIRCRLAELATESRRRERSEQVSRRATVRELARSGGMPSLADLLAARDSLFDGAAPLASSRAFLSTGGEVGFGFATRPGTIAFTDGRRQRQARTWEEARSLFDEGWEPGTPGIPGVRVHLPGSRVERVVPVDEVVIEPPADG
jgi:hypothetical protein